MMESPQAAASAEASVPTPRSRAANPLNTPLMICQVRDRPFAALMSSGCAQDRLEAAGWRKYSRTSGPAMRRANSARLTASRSAAPMKSGNSRSFRLLNMKAIRRTS